VSLAAQLHDGEPEAVSPAQGRRASGTGDLFQLANGPSTTGVLSWLGIQTEERSEKTFATCPGCGEDGALLCKDGGIKCLHDRCAHVGPAKNKGFRTNVDIVLTVRGWADARAADAAKEICAHYGIKVPELRRTERDLDGENEPDLTDAFGPGEPPEMPGDDEAPSTEGFRVTRIEIIDSAAIFAELEAPDYLMDGIIVRGTITEIIAYGYSGKSWLGINAVNSVGAGVPWLERFPATQGAALFGDWESGKYECRRRLKLDALGRDLVTPIAGVSLVTMPGLYMTDPLWPSEMERLMDGRALVVIDTLKAANPKADENSSEVRVGLDYMRRPLERTGCAAIVLAHAKKTSGSVTTIDPREAGRGSSAIFDAADAVLHVTYTEGEPLRVQQTKARCGKAVAPFLVEIIDTPNGGVRVAAKDEQAAGTATDSARFDALCSDVLSLVREHPGASGRVLRQRVTGRPASVLAALEVLERSGAIRNTGSPSNAKWFPTGGDA
jgi:hypothetical protein